MTLDLTKPYRTREGGEAQAIAGPDGRLYGWMHIKNHHITSGSWTVDGLYFKTGEANRFDLVNIPEVRTVTIWINFYDGCGPSGHQSRGEADRISTSERIACIERTITYHVGEGVEK